MARERPPEITAFDDQRRFTGTARLTACPGARGGRSTGFVPGGGAARHRSAVPRISGAAAHGSLRGGDQCRASCEPHRTVPTAGGRSGATVADAGFRRCVLHQRGILDLAGHSYWVATV